MFEHLFQFCLGNLTPNPSPLVERGEKHMREGGQLYSSWFVTDHDLLYGNTDTPRLMYNLVNG